MIDVKSLTLKCLMLLASTTAAHSEPKVEFGFKIKAGESDIYNQAISWPDVYPSTGNAYCSLTHFQLPNDDTAKGAWVIVAPVFEGEDAPWGISVSKGVTAHASCLIFE